MNLSSVFSPSSVRRNPDAIARRAYDIWNQEGRPDGCDLRHWLQAEQELSAESTQNAESSVSDVRVSSNGNGTSNGDGRAHESTATPESARTSSASDRETPPVPAVGTPNRASKTETPGKATRGNASKRRGSGSGRGPAL